MSERRRLAVGTVAEVFEDVCGDVQSSGDREQQPADRDRRRGSERVHLLGARPAEVHEQGTQHARPRSQDDDGDECGAAHGARTRDRVDRVRVPAAKVRASSLA